MAKFRDPDFDMSDPKNRVGNKGTGRPQRNYKFVDGNISHTGKAIIFEYVCQNYYLLQAILLYILQTEQLIYRLINLVCHRAAYVYFNQSQTRISLNSPPSDRADWPQTSYATRLQTRSISRYTKTSKML